MSALLVSSETSFIDAASCGDLSYVQSLLSSPSCSPSQINALDKNGRSAFHYSCLNDDIPLLTTLLADSRVDVLQLTPNHDNAIHLATLYSSNSALKLLISDPRTLTLLNAQNKYGETPLHGVAGSGDANAAVTARLLLSYDAKLNVVDKWGRGACDVSRDNAENPLVVVFKEYLNDDDKLTLKAEVDEITLKYKEANLKIAKLADGLQLEKKSILFNSGGILSGLKGLKKTKTVVKNMFNENEGNITNKVNSMKTTPKQPSDSRTALSKLIDFPGDSELIKDALENKSSTINPGGFDSFGLTALHKFSSWNKTLLLEMILPCLSKDEINQQDLNGKTALHWSIEMASVGSVKILVKHGIDASVKDGNGKTAMEILEGVERSGVIDRLILALTRGE